MVLVLEFSVARPETLASGTHNNHKRIITLHCIMFPLAVSFSGLLRFPLLCFTVVYLALLSLFSALLRVPVCC